MLSQEGDQHTENPNGSHPHTATAQQEHTRRAHPDDNRSSDTESQLDPLVQAFNSITNTLHAGNLIILGVGHFAEPGVLTLSRETVFRDRFLPGTSGANDRVQFNLLRGSACKRVAPDGQKTTITTDERLQIAAIMIQGLRNQLDIHHAKGSTTIENATRWASELILSIPESSRAKWTQLGFGLEYSLGMLAKKLKLNDIAEQAFQAQINSGEDPSLRTKSIIELSRFYSGSGRLAEARILVQDCLNDMEQSGFRDFSLITALNVQLLEYTRRERWIDKSEELASQTSRRFGASPDFSVAKNITGVIWRTKGLNLLAVLIYNIKIPFLILTSPLAWLRASRAFQQRRVTSPQVIPPISPQRFNAQQVQRIAILRLDRLGDLVCMLPVLQRIRDEFPDATIDLFTTKGIESVAERSGLIDRVIGIRWKKQGWLKDTLNSLENKQYDLLIDLLEEGKARHVKLARELNTTHSVGFDKKSRRGYYNFRVLPPQRRMHLTDLTLHLLNGIGISHHNTDRVPHLPVDPTRKAAAKATLAESLGARKVIGIHVGAGWKFKRWYPERFAEVGAKLRDQYNCSIAVFYGPKEKELADRVVAGIGEHSQAISGSLDQFIDLASVCELMIVNDSGPMHVSAAVDTPTAVVWGPGDFELFAARGKALRMVHQRPMCANCPQELDTKRCPMGYTYEEVPCLDDISVDMVVSACQELLDGAHQSDQPNHDGITVQLNQLTPQSS